MLESLTVWDVVAEYVDRLMIPKEIAQCERQQEDVRCSTKSEDFVKKPSGTP